LEATAEASLERGEARDHDHELVAAHARDGVASRTHTRCGCHRLQQPVAELVPERVVDGLEVVEVDEEHGELGAVAMRLRDRCWMRSRNSTRWEAGERVRDAPCARCAARRSCAR